MRYHTKAGLLYLLPALAVVVVWYLLLFQGNSPALVPGNTLAFVLTEGPRPWWFRWLFALPFLCLSLSLAYMSRLATFKTGSAALLVLGCVLAIASWLTVTSEIALFTTLPLLYGVLVARERFGRQENDA